MSERNTCGECPKPAVFLVEITSHSKFSCFDHLARVVGQISTVRIAEMGPEFLALVSPDDVTVRTLVDR